MSDSLINSMMPVTPSSSLSPPCPTLTFWVSEENPVSASWLPDLHKAKGAADELP